MYKPEKYDNAKAVLDGNRGILGAIFAELQRRGRRRARYGENLEIAAMFGVTGHEVASARCAWNRGHLWNKNSKVPNIRGWHAIWPQPLALPARLIALESARPGLTRKEQAAILGTTYGALRDAAYRIRLRRPDLVSDLARGA